MLGWVENDLEAFKSPKLNTMGKYVILLYSNVRRGGICTRDSPEEP